jgi:Cu/Ag efflux protein CusF
MSRRLALLIAVLLISGGISTSAYPSMDGIEWLTRVEQIQASQGLPARRHVRSQGDVATVDPGAGTISVFHREMQSADGSIWMPAMHMVFHVTTRDLLKGLNPGDHVHFTVGRHRGAVMITQINKAP